MTVINKNITNTINTHYGVIIHRDFVPLSVDDNFVMIFGFNSKQEFLENHSLLDVIHPDEYHIVKGNYQKTVQSNERPEARLCRNINKQGEVIYVLAVDKLVEYQGEKAMQVTVIEITQIIETQKRLVEIEDRYQELVEDSLQAMLVHKNFNPVFCNKAYAKLLGFDNVAEVLALDTILHLIPEQNRAGTISENISLISGELPFTRYETAGFTSHNEEIWVELIAKRIKWKGEYAVQVSAIDITEQHLLRQQIKHKATFDGLTQVMNRTSIAEKLEFEIANCKANNKPLSIVLIDLDNFKKVNDTYGHESGDIVLKEFTQNCRNWLRQSDLIGRWGGEEFILVLPDSNQDVACLLANRLREQIAKLDINITDQVINITVSMGVSTIQDMCITSTKLLARADEALYKAKRTGKNKVVVEHCC